MNSYVFAGSSIQQQPIAAAFFQGFQAGAIFQAGASAINSYIDEPEREWRRTVMKRLNALAALEIGWDGYNARPISFSTAHFAMRMLDSICGSEVPAPQIVPGASGDLQIEWHTDDGDIELHVTEPYRVHAWSLINGAEQEIDLTNDFTLVGKWIAALLGSCLVDTAAA